MRSSCSSHRVVKRGRYYLHSTATQHTNGTYRRAPFTRRKSSEGSCLVHGAAAAARVVVCTPWQGPRFDASKSSSTFAGRLNMTSQPERKKWTTLGRQGPWQLGPDDLICFLSDCSVAGWQGKAGLGWDCGIQEIPLGCRPDLAKLAGLAVRGLAILHAGQPVPDQRDRPVSPKFRRHLSGKSQGGPHSARPFFVERGKQKETNKNKIKSTRKF